MGALLAVPAVVSGRWGKGEGSPQEYIEFEGPSLVGYSGGPVLGAAGKVVAIVAEEVPLEEGRNLNIAYEVDVKE